MAVQGSIDAGRSDGSSALIEANSDVALIAVDGVAALVGASNSWIHDEIRAGRFPAPVIRQTRFTRWRLADVRAWIHRRVSEAEADQANGGIVIARAKRASDAAKAKRASVAREAAL